MICQKGSIIVFDLTNYSFFLNSLAYRNYKYHKTNEKINLNTIKIYNFTNNLRKQCTI